MSALNLAFKKQGGAEKAKLGARTHVVRRRACRQGGRKPVSKDRVATPSYDKGEGGGKIKPVSQLNLKERTMLTFIPTAKAPDGEK